MKGCAARSSRSVRAVAAAAVVTGRYQWEVCGCIRNSSRLTSMVANSSMPARSTRVVRRTPSAARGTGVLGSRRRPRTRQARESGMLTARVARQPPTPISRPPRVGPMTAMVWLATESAVSTPAGLSCPVRRASLRMRCIEAG
ncbi:hypothetical protein GCM10025734_10870 [Kitasatospora paranensis]